MKHVHLDLETFSSVDLKAAGVYPYTEADDFEILIAAWSVNGGLVKVVDCVELGGLPEELCRLLEEVERGEAILCAHNATFERLCLKAYGFVIPPEFIICTMVLCFYAGLPAKLESAAKALRLEEQKDAAGTALINYFSKIQKPTKKRPRPFRNTKKDDPVKWASYMKYCGQDVRTEIAILEELEYEGIRLPKEEKEYYALDQRINDFGIEIDVTLVKRCVEASAYFSKPLIAELKELTGLENPNSGAQLLAWVNSKLHKDDALTSLDKKNLAAALLWVKGEVKEALELKKVLAKTSVTKYKRALQCLCKDGRVRGLVQFYGAGTGRWAGRLIQIQNLPRNYVKNLDLARRLVKRGDFEALEMCYGNPIDVLSQLIRTMFVAARKHSFSVGDWSAIEARLTAWLAGEKWRLDVFNTHGLIYEASAAMMFKVPLESISYKDENGKKVEGPNYDLRQKGKIAELALGYQGSLGAMLQMGGLEMGLTENEMKGIVKLFRSSNPSIVALWAELNKAAIESVKNRGKKVFACKGRLVFISSANFMQIVLPSGRSLYYREPALTRNKWGGESVYHMGIVRPSGKWGKVHTYGGKLVENVIQAIARDMLAGTMLNLYYDGYDVVLHVHDEIGIEDKKAREKATLKHMLKLMNVLPYWADGLPIGAEGFTNDYYKKD